MASELIRYETWQDEVPEHPPRSHLYFLSALGVGTPLVEGLTSFTCRLAQAHCLLVGDLIKHEIAPLIRLIQDKAEFQAKPGKCPSPQAMNGYGAPANLWREALETLTLQPNLSLLTLLPWTQVLARDTTKLLSPYRKWCPQCYIHWQDSNQPIYDPLLWSFHQVEVCAHHACPMEQRCPYTDCNQRSFLISAKMRPGYCAKCGRWLGKIGDRPSAHREFQNLAHQEWIAKVVGDLLATTLTVEDFPERSKVAHMLSTYTAQVAGGNVKEMALLLGVHPTSLRRWCQGIGLPSFACLLHICRTLEISPLHVLTEEPSLLDTSKVIQQEQNLNPGPQQHKKKKKRETFITTLGDTLQAYLLCDPPLSLKEVARQVEYSPIHLHRLVPGLCAQIKERFRTYIRQKSIEREQRIQEEVTQATRKIHALGLHPTSRRVRACLTTPNDFRRPGATLAWRNTKRELGL